MPKYRLHYFPESGNSYKLALMLTLCGERFEGVWTDFAGNATLLYYMSEEAQEGRNAFVERRKPDFKKFPRLP